MAYGLGYAIIDGVLGATAGAGQGIADQALLEQKTQIEQLRDQRLAQLQQQTHAANTASDIAAKEADATQNAQRTAQFFQNNKLPTTPITNAATATYDDPNNPGQTDTSTSNPVTTQEQPSDRAQAANFASKALETGRPEIISAAENYQKNVLGAQDMDRKNALEQSKVGLEAQRNGYYVALAKKYNAEADVLAQGGKAIPAPMVNKAQDDDGHNYLLDTHSGAIGHIVPGQAAVAAETHWYGDKPGQDAVPMHEEWTLGGKPLPGGLRALYPTYFARMDGANKGAGKSGGLIDTAADDGSQLTGEIAAQANSDMPASAGAQPTPAASSPAATTAPRQGAIVNGYRFKGGDPHNKSSWEKV